MMKLICQVLEYLQFRLKILDMEFHCCLCAQFFMKNSEENYGDKSKCLKGLYAILKIRQWTTEILTLFLIVT